MNNIAEVYNRHKNLKHSADELGMKWQTLYYQLKKQGVAIVGDKARYGSDSDRLAARAEMLFRDLVPFANDQNETQFQAKFDFLVGDQRIDIKAARLAQSSKAYSSKRWAFSVKKQEFCADFIVCFGFNDDNDGFITLLIPGEMVRKYQTISISERGNSKWLQFKVEPTELNEFFLNYLPF